MSNTAFRGFGGPQGMVAIEAMHRRHRPHLGIDPLDVRKRNFYGGPGRDMTPYGMQVERQRHAASWSTNCWRASDYRARRAAIAAFNADSRVLKRGIALTPVKFGISFTATSLNQAGALVHVYTDGSVLLNHGGTEMGQGLFTKIAQVVAEEFGIDLDKVQDHGHRRPRRCPTPRRPPPPPAPISTAWPRKRRRATIKERLVDFAAESGRCRRSQSCFCDSQVLIGEPVDLASPNSSSRPISPASRCPRPASTRRPKIHWDAKTATGPAVLLLRLRRRRAPKSWSTR